MGVFPDEGYMVARIAASVRHLAANRPGPQAYLATYLPYYYILDGTADNDLKQFFGQEPPPYLKVRALPRFSRSYSLL